MTLPSAGWRPGVLRLGAHELDLSRRVAVMGIVNATPDSFYAGGRHASAEAAIEHGLRIAAEGANLIDVGGDSAGGSAAPIDAAEEIRRVEPVIRALARQTNLPISVDTHRADTAAAAIDAGAALVNDITGLADPKMSGVVARGRAGLCLMHIKGAPKHFPPDFHYDDVVTDVRAYLGACVDRALEAGIARDRLIVDPGIEFGKLVSQDLQLLRRLNELHTLELPVLVAISRKYFIGHVLGTLQPSEEGAPARVTPLPPEDRLEGTAAAIAFAITRGAHIVRVHDVSAMVRVTHVTEALLGLTHITAHYRSDGEFVPV